MENSQRRCRCDVAW